MGYLVRRMELVDSLLEKSKLRHSMERMWFPLQSHIKQLETVNSSRRRMPHFLVDCRQLSPLKEQDRQCRTARTWVNRSRKPFSGRGTSWAMGVEKAPLLSFALYHSYSSLRLWSWRGYTLNIQALRAAVFPPQN